MKNIKINCHAMLNHKTSGANHVRLDPNIIIFIHQMVSKQSYELLATEGVKGFMEPHLYAYGMHYANGNQSKAAKFLGISRGTLRIKLLKYFGTLDVGRRNSRVYCDFQILS